MRELHSVNRVAALTERTIEGTAIRLVRSGPEAHGAAAVVTADGAVVGAGASREAGGAVRDEASLRRRMGEILVWCELNGIDSLALPPLGAGTGGLSPDAAAAALLDEVASHVQYPTKLRTVVIALMRDDLYAAYARALAAIDPFPPC